MDYSIDTTYVKSFAGEIANMVITGYNTCLLQRHPLQVCGLTVSMVMHSNFNTLSVHYNGLNLSTNLWSQDSEELTENCIVALINGILR